MGSAFLTPLKQAIYLYSEEEDKVKGTLKLSGKQITGQGGGKRVLMVTTVY